MNKGARITARGDFCCSDVLDAGNPWQPKCYAFIAQQAYFTGANE